MLVTAAAQGMGRAAALALAREGAQVIATDVRDDPPALLSDESQRGGGAPIEVRGLDATDAAAIGALIDALPPLDVLFNCAGYVHQGTILETDEHDWDASFTLNVCLMFRTIKAALPKMLAHGGGSIINMASVCSSEKGFPNRFVYGTTKAAVIGRPSRSPPTSSRAASAATASRPARSTRRACTTGCASSATSTRRGGCSPRASRWAGWRSPTRSWLIVVYLASDESAFATGQVFRIDGGITIEARRAGQ